MPTVVALRTACLQSRDMWKQEERGPKRPGCHGYQSWTIFSTANIVVSAATLTYKPLVAEKKRTCEKKWNKNDHY